MSASSQCCNLTYESRLAHYGCPRISHMGEHAERTAEWLDGIMVSVAGDVVSGEASSSLEERIPIEAKTNV